jgi:hypothetical protein
LEQSKTELPAKTPAFIILQFCRYILYNLQMDFIQKILQYYHTESRHGFTAAAIGILLLISSVLLWRFARPLSLLKGLSLPFLLIGLLMGIGGLGDGYVTRKALPEKLRLYNENKSAFFKEEVPKVERTHRSWPGIRKFWGIVTATGAILSLAGAVLLFTMKKSYWIGVGLGALLMGILGNIEEAISMRFNERYYREVLQAAKPHIVTQIRETEPQKIIPVAVQRLAIKQNVAVEARQDKQPKIERDTLTVLQPPLFPNTIQKTSSGKPIEVLAINDLADHTEPGSVENAMPVKKKKLLDYYRSDLIQANGVSLKHCWFGKKYLD